MQVPSVRAIKGTRRIEIPSSPILNFGIRWRSVDWFHAPAALLRRKEPSVLTGFRAVYAPLSVERFFFLCRREYSLAAAANQIRLVQYVT
jgi:hypothetical protein